MELDIIDETQRLDDKQLQLLEDIVRFSADFLNLPEATECAVTIVDNPSIQAINRDYRGKDMPTDVISFALDDDDSDHFDNHLLPHHIGDIIISIDKAKEQANEYGHTLDRELGFLAVHGFLHLNGYDHMTSEEEKQMFTLQNDIFTAFGLER